MKTRLTRRSTIVVASLALTVPLFGAALPLGATSASAAPTLPTLVINEIDASGVPKDWIELKNIGAASVDASGLILKDDKDADRFDIPAGTIIPAGGYASFDVGDAFGLGKSADSARLYEGDNTTLIDSFTWDSDSSPATWGRCPDGTGAFAVTKTGTRDALNDCSAQAPTGNPTPRPTPAPTPTPTPTPTPDPGTVPGALPWPGAADVHTASTKNFFGTNLSGLSYQLGATAAADTLWGVRNGPSTLYKLQKSGADWVAPASGEWSAGKSLKYPDGTGDPDAEGVAYTADGIFVSTERNNDNGKVSRPAVLKYDPNAAGSTISATMEWNLTSDLPPLGANLSAEGITFVPDAYLTSKGFIDETTGAAYNPGGYPNHGTGLYFVGIEGNGTIYAYALDQTDGTKFTRVATIASGFPAVMEVQYDPEKSAIWAVCDNTCGGQYALLDIAKSGSSSGHFGITAVYNRPAGMGDFNNEGFTTAPQARCLDGTKPVLWADDNQDDGYSLREGTIDCVAAPTATGPTATDPTATDPTATDPTSTPVSSTSGATGTGTAVLAATGAEPLFAGASALVLLLAGVALVLIRRRFAATLPRRPGFTARLW